MKQALGWLLVATLALTVPYAARAVEDEDTGTQGTGRVDEPQVPVLWKLGRGLQNAAWGLPAEIVKNTLSEAFKSDTAFGFGSGIFEGVLVGIGKGFWRVGAVLPLADTLSSETGCAPVAAIRVAQAFPLSAALYQPQNSTLSPGRRYERSEISSDTLTGSAICARIGVPAALTVTSVRVTFVIRPAIS